LPGLTPYDGYGARSSSSHLADIISINAVKNLRRQCSFRFSGASRTCHALLVLYSCRNARHGRKGAAHARLQNDNGAAIPEEQRRQKRC